MLKLIRLVLYFLGLIVVVGLAVANREPVSLSFYPFPITYQLPLFALLLITLAIGCLLGACAVWLNAHRVRVQARAMRRTERVVAHEERVQRQGEDRAIVEAARQRAAGGAGGVPTATVLPAPLRG